MRLNLTELSEGIIKELSFSYPLTVEDEFFNVTFPEPLNVRGIVKNTAGYISLSVNAEITYHTFCDRCLKPIDSTLRFDIKRTLVKKGSLQSDDDLEYLEIEGDGFVDIDDTVREEFVLAFPMKHLCSEQCKGLCQSCGKNLNDGSCSCKEEKAPSVWDEALKKLAENESGEK